MDFVRSSGAFLYTLAIGLVAGIALGLMCSVGVAFLVLGVAGALVLVAFGALLHNKKIFLVAIALLALVLGLVRADLSLATLWASSRMIKVGQMAASSSKPVGELMLEYE